jgi:integrase
VPHRKARTAQYYEQIITSHLEPTFSAMLLSEIRLADVRRFVAKKLADGAARNTVMNMAATRRSILYAAVGDEIIQSNPAARVGRMFGLRHDPRVHVVVLEAAQVAQVLAAAHKWYPDHALLVTTLFLTGMRAGEALGLQWTDLDPARNLIDLQRTVSIRGKKATAEESSLIVNTPKSGRLRIVDCPGGLMSQFQETLSIARAEAALTGRPLAPRVFPAAIDPTRPLNASWFWRHVWSPLLEKAAVRAIRIHDARHTYASLMLRRGVPIAYVSRQLGHSSIQITVDLYGHFVPGGDRHHADGLAAAIEAERVAAEACALSPHDSVPAPDGTLAAPREAAV